MPKQPRRIPNPNEPCQLAIRIPGWFKNQIIDHCQTQNIPITTWITAQIQQALHEARGIPQPPPATTPLPTTADQIRAYALGQRLTLPCGKTGQCPGLNPNTLNGLAYCPECGIRVT